MCILINRTGSGRSRKRSQVRRAEDTWTDGWRAGTERRRADTAQAGNVRQRRQVTLAWHKPRDSSLENRQPDSQIASGEGDENLQQEWRFRKDTEMDWRTCAYLCLVFLDFVPPVVSPIRQPLIWLSVRCHVTVHTEKKCKIVEHVFNGSKHYTGDLNKEPED